MRRATFQAFLGLRVQSGLPELLGEAAEKAKQSPAAYARQAIIERLQRDGLTIEAGNERRRSSALKAA